MYIWNIVKYIIATLTCVVLNSLTQFAHWMEGWSFSYLIVISFHTMIICLSVIIHGKVPGIHPSVLLSHFMFSIFSLVHFIILFFLRSTVNFNVMDICVQLIFMPSFECTDCQIPDTWPIINLLSYSHRNWYLCEVSYTSMINYVWMSIHHHQNLNIGIHL